MASGVLFFAESQDGQLKKSALEMANAGRGLAEALGGPFAGVVIGHEVAGIAGVLERHGVPRIYVADDPALAPKRRHAQDPDPRLFCQRDLGLVTETSACQRILARPAIEELANIRRVLFVATRRTFVGSDSGRVPCRPVPGGCGDDSGIGATLVSARPSPWRFGGRGRTTARRLGPKRLVVASCAA